MVFDSRHLSSNIDYSFFYSSNSNEQQPGIPFAPFLVYQIFKDPVDETALDIQIGKTFFYFFQEYLYGLHPGPDWFSKAAYVWIEELFYDPFGTLGDFFPDVLLGKELDCLSGWGRNDEDVMVPIVKYLADKSGVNNIGHYHFLIQHKYSVYQALDSIGLDPLKTWAPRFFQNYLEGNIYGIKGDELSNAFEIVDWAVRYYNADQTLRGNTHWLSMLSTNSDSYLEVIFTDPE